MSETSGSGVNFVRQSPDLVGPVEQLPKGAVSRELGKITHREILAASERPLEKGGTRIFLQVNAKDDRSKDATDLGALVPESAQMVQDGAKESLDKILAGIPEGERKDVKIVVIAGDHTLETPGGLKSPHKRAVESGERVITGLRSSLFEHHLLEEQLLNNSAESGAGGKPIEVTGLRDLAMFESPEFVKFMTDKYGTDGTALWEAYEADADKETRIAMGVEGPDEIAERVNYTVSLQAQLAKEFHEHNPGQRLIVWAVGSYDSLSPYIKRNVQGVDPAKNYLGMDKSGGIALDIAPDGGISTTIQGKKLPIKSVLPKIPENPEKFPIITSQDIKLDPPANGTTIVFQRHAKYQREDGPGVGSLVEGAYEEQRDLVQGMVGNLFDSLGDDAGKTDFLVLGSDTFYRGGGQRSMETAAAALEGISIEIESRGLKSVILNNQEDGKPRPTPSLREPNMFTEAPDFVKFMEEKYPKDFWKFYEEDIEKEIRESVGAEGPIELGDRLAKYERALERYSRFYHKSYPGRRLVIWAATHYDTISPYVKNHVMKKSGIQPVDYGGGISINIDSEGRSKTSVAGVDYFLPS